MTSQTQPTAILPPATIGVLGSGQLGRMMAIAARQMGYRVHVFSPGRDTPTGQVADKEISAAYDDLAAVRAFARDVAVVTYEFENVPAATAAAAAEFAPVRPGQQVLHVAQNRWREKTAFRAAGLPTVPFAKVGSRAELDDALATIGAPAVLKSAESGYDGKGQFKLDRADQADAAWDAVDRRDAILEAFVHFEREISVVSARGLDGTIVDYGVIENDHVNHILDLSVAPASVAHDVARTAVTYAHTVMTALDVIGVLCVEFFVTHDGRVLLNEIAPRPHNSGHLTVDACVTSQFEQQVRAVCGLPLGATTYHAPAAMVNLLGDLWADGEPHWADALANPAVKLHLYGKAAARIGRKMGHLTALAPTTTAAADIAQTARTMLTK